MSDLNTQNLAALNGDAVFDLRHLALIGVDGDDAEAFLQGQLTNDLREVSATRTQLSAWCSPKGRVLSGFLVLRHQDRLLLQLPQSLAQQTLARMRMFILRAKASLEDRSAELMRMGLVGEAAVARLQERFGPLPAVAGESRALDQVTIIHLGGRRPRFEVLGPAAVLTPLWDACRDVSVAAGAGAWELLNIEAGVAEIGPGTSDAFVPQMITLDRIGGVSFTKGCYVGQEIVARTQHLGRIKRRMYRAHLAGGAPVAAGDMLHAAALSAQVVNAQPSPAGGVALLAVMAIEHAEGLPADGVTLDSGAQLTLQTLPYALEGEIA